MRALRLFVLLLLLLLKVLDPSACTLERACRVVARVCAVPHVQHRQVRTSYCERADRSVAHALAEADAQFPQVGAVEAERHDATIAQSRDSDELEALQRACVVLRERRDRVVGDESASEQVDRLERRARPQERLDAFVRERAAVGVQVLEERALWIEAQRPHFVGRQAERSEVGAPVCERADVAQYRAREVQRPERATTVVRDRVDRVVAQLAPHLDVLEARAFECELRDPRLGQRRTRSQVEVPNGRRTLGRRDARRCDVVEVVAVRDIEVHQVVAVCSERVESSAHDGEARHVDVRQSRAPSCKCGDAGVRDLRARARTPPPHAVHVQLLEVRAHSAELGEREVGDRVARRRERVVAHPQVSQLGGARATRECDDADVGHLSTLVDVDVRERRAVTCECDDVGVARVGEPDVRERDAPRREDRHIPSRRTSRRRHLRHDEGAQAGVQRT